MSFFLFSDLINQKLFWTLQGRQAPQTPSTLNSICTNPCQAKDRIDAFREHADLINTENKILDEGLVL
jgi:hypothetical protein